MFISLAIPLKFTRVSLYWIISLVTICGSLFPWSILASIRLYQLLVPDPIVSHPVSFSYSFRNRGPFTIVNSYEFLSRLVDLYDQPKVLQTDPQFRQSALSEFEITFKYAYSRLQNADASDLLGVRFSVIDDSMLNGELTPWQFDPKFIDEKSRHTRLWPITDRLPGVTKFANDTNMFLDRSIAWPFDRSVVDGKTTKQSMHSMHSIGKSLLLSLWPESLQPSSEEPSSRFCPGVYYTETRWIKMKSRSWLSDWFHPKRDLPLLDVRFPTDKLTILSRGKVNQLVEDSKHIKLVVEFTSPGIFVDRSDLEFTVRLQGLRYYFYHYRLAFLIMTTLLFWISSSLVCICVSYGLFIYRMKQEELNQPVKVSPRYAVTSITASSA